MVKRNNRPSTMGDSRKHICTILHRQPDCPAAASPAVPFLTFSPIVFMPHALVPCTSLLLSHMLFLLSIGAAVFSSFNLFHENLKAFIAEFVPLFSVSRGTAAHCHAPPCYWQTERPWSSNHRLELSVLQRRLHCFGNSVEMRHQGIRLFFRVIL